MSDFSLLVKLAADSSAFDAGLKSAAQRSKQFGQEAQAMFVATRTPAEQYRTAITKVSDAYAMGRVDLVTYQRALKKINDEFTVTAQLVPQATSKLSGLGQGMAGSLLGFSTGVGAIIAGTMLAVRAIESLASAAAGAAIEGIKLAADFEKAEIAFGTVFKSATKAKQVMREIQTFAAATPFEFPELKDAAVKLAGFGTSSKQIVPTLKMLGDIAAGTGANINELAVTYGKARVQGRAYTKDVNEFATAGAPIWEALQTTLGKTNEQVHAMVEEGVVGFPELQRALLSLTEAGGMYEGATERQSQSLLGLYSTLRDNINLTLADIGASAVRELDLKGATKSAIDFTGTFKNEIGPVLVEAAQAMKLVATAANQMSKALDLGDYSAKGLSSGLANLHATLDYGRALMAKFTGDTSFQAQNMADIVMIGLRQAKAQSGGVGKLQVETDPDKQSHELAEAIAATNAKLKEEIATFGMSADQKEVWKLKQQGATDAMLQETQALNARRAAQKKMADETKKTAKEQEDAAKRQEAAEKQLIKSLEDKVAVLKKQKVQNDLAQHAQEFGAVPQRAMELQQELERLEKDKETRKKAEKAKKEAEDAAKAIIEDTKTPWEKYVGQANKIFDLWKKGLLTKEQGQRAVRKAEDEFLAGAKTPTRTSENRTLLRGTSEAFSAINRANDKKTQEKIAKDQLTVLKQSEIIHRRQLEALKNVGVWGGRN